MLASEAPSSSISKNQKKSFKSGHFYAKLSIKIDTPKCLKITVVMLVHLRGILFSSSWGMSFAIKCKFDRDSALKRGKIAHSQGLVNVICVRLKAVRYWMSYPHWVEILSQGASFIIHLFLIFHIIFPWNNCTTEIEDISCENARWIKIARLLTYIRKDFNPSK